MTFVLLGAATWLILIQPKQSTASSLQSTIAATRRSLRTRPRRTPGAKATHKHALSQTVIASRALPNLVAMPQILLQLSRIASEEHVSLDLDHAARTVPYSGYEACR